MSSAIVVLLGVGLGWDSLSVGFGLGATTVTWRRMLVLAALFGAADGLASLAGLALGRALISTVGGAAHAIGVALIAATGYSSLVGPESARAALTRRWALVRIPFALSLDNLSTGAGIGVLGRSALDVAWWIGSVSGLMALTGFMLGALLRTQLPRSACRVGGTVLLACAACGIMWR